MSELSKRKNAFFEEMQQNLEKSDNILILTSIEELLGKLNEHFADMAEISSRAKYYDDGLSEKIEFSISELKTAFSNIKPPTINVTPNIDAKPFQAALNRIGENNQTLINLVEKFNGNQSESLEKLITSFVEKQNFLIEREFKQFDYTDQFKGIEKGINNRPTEIISTVTKRSNDSLRTIEEVTSKIVFNGR